jgi:glycosyltransferase involved in cell wall biosynthesis
VTSLLIDFFIEKEFEVFLVVAKTGIETGSVLDKHAGLMYQMEGTLNSTENLAWLDRFIDENKIGCVIDQGMFSDACFHAKQHKETRYITTLHSCPFYEVERFAGYSLRQLMKTEKSSYKRFTVFVRYLMNQLKPGLSHPQINEFYRKRIEAVNHFVVLHDSYKKMLERRLFKGIEQTNILSIPDPLKLPPVITEAKSKTVIYVGRLAVVPKRVDRLLRIWKTIQKDISDWNLNIVGDGDDKAFLENLANELKLERVRFLGRQHPEPFYKEASILCLTSSYEGWGLVITEAQSFGTIPVTFNCTKAMADMISNHIDGILVEPGDETTFARELLALIKNDDLRDRMRYNAIKKVGKLDIKAVGQHWLQLVD